MPDPSLRLAPRSPPARGCSRQQHGLVSILLLAALVGGPPAAAQVPFSDVSAATGLDLGGAKHGGLSWGDLNDDGCLDQLVNAEDWPEQSRLMLQYAPGGVCAGTFDDVTDCIVTGLNDHVVETCCAERSALWGDIDNDGDVDLVINTDNSSTPEDRGHSVEVFLGTGAGSTPGAACGYDPDGNSVIDPVPWGTYEFSGDVAINLTKLLDFDGIPPDTRLGQLQHLLIDDINLEHVSFNDFDADGDLDLLMDNHSRGVVVLRNRWDSAPAEWTPCGSPPCAQTPLVHDTTNGLPFCTDDIDDPPILTCSGNDGDYGASADFDRDGDVDFIVRKPTGTADLFVNDGAGPQYFDDAVAGVDLDDSSNGNKGGVSPCDFDSDGDLDFFWTDNGVNQVWEQTGSPATPAADGSGSFADTITGGCGTGEPACSSGVDFTGDDVDDAVCGDYDNDGDLDLFLSAGTRAAPAGDFFFRNELVENGGILAPPADRLEFSCQMGPDPACAIDTTTCDTASGHVGCGTGEGAVFGDYDRDGDLDLAINQSDDAIDFPGRIEFNEVWRNTTDNANYLKVRALWDIDGVAGGDTRAAIGATIQLLDCGGRPMAPIQEVSGGRGHGAQDPATVHFGFQFGATYPYFVRVEYVGGTVVQVAVLPTSLGLDQTLTVRSTDSDSVVCVTPATVGALTGRESADGLWLEFETFAELATLGFRVYRSAAGQAFTADPATLVGDAFLLAQPPSIAGSRYRVLDRAAEPPYGRLRYYVVETDTAGAQTVRGTFTLTALEPAAATATGMPAPAHEPGYERLPRALAVAISDSGRPESRAPAASRRTAAAPVALKLLVRERGLVYLSASTIASGLGLELAEVTTRLLEGTLALDNLGLPVAWRTSTDGQGLLFFAEESPSPYAALNVYWLRPGTGLLMAEAAGTPPPPPLPFADGFESGDLSAWSSSTAGPPSATTSVPVNRAFEESRFAATASTTDPESDYWFWVVLSAGHPTLGHATLELEIEAPTATTDALVALELLGATAQAPAPELRALLNSVELEPGPPLPAGRNPQPFPSLYFAVPPGVLLAGTNTLEIEALGPTGGASVHYLDRVSVAYQRELRAVADHVEFVASASRPVRVDGFTTPDLAVLELSDPRRPTWVSADADASGAGFGVRFVPSAAGVPYLVVSSGAFSAPEELRAAFAEPSVLDTASGVEHLVITHSSLATEAERLIAHRAAQGLSSALLDARLIYDQLSFGLEDPRAIRALLELTEPDAGERFVVLAGHGHYDYRDYRGFGSNLVPPLLQASSGGLVASDQRFVDYALAPRTIIGRIPAHDAAELGRYLDKVMAYEAGAGSWTSSVLLLADHVPDQSEFDYGSEVLEAALTPPFTATRVSLRESGVAGARQQLFQALADGAAFLGYTGHGGIDRFSADGLLTSTDVPTLQNSARAPIVTALTCNVARFDLPGHDSLGETLIVGTNGAAALLGSVALSDSHQALDLGMALYTELVSGEHARLGQAIAAARQALHNAFGDSEIQALYTLLGDPALLLP